MKKCTGFGLTLVFTMFSGLSLFADIILFDSDKLGPSAFNLSPNTQKLEQLDKGPSGGKCLSVKGYALITGKKLFPVEPETKYRLSAFFRSAGKKPSSVIFGFIPYDKNKKEIRTVNVNIVKNTETRLVNAIKKGDKKLEVADASAWEKIRNKKYVSIAFNIDDSGDLRDLPNFSLSSPGIEKIEKKDGHWNILLRHPLSETYPAGTKIRAHMGASPYMNCVFNKSVPENWTAMSSVSLIGQEWYGNSKLRWRRGTAFVRIMLLANWREKEDTDLRFASIKFVEEADAVINIGSRLEPMVDKYLIDKMTGGAGLELQRPVDREIVMDLNKPWEGNTCSYFTIFRDGDRYRMYYRAWDYDLQKKKVSHPAFICYAESRDGIHWDRPGLGIVEFNGSKNNNILIASGSEMNLAVFKDMTPGCKPDEKYKAVSAKTTPEAHRTGFKGLYLYKSPDGLHWTKINDRPVVSKGGFDTHNIGFRDSFRNCYREYHRSFNKYGCRDIMTGTSKDFLKWPEPVGLNYYAYLKPEHLYTIDIRPYFRAPHILIALPSRFIPDRQGTEHPYPGVSDVVFMSSRDGTNFRRWAEAFIRPGLQKCRWVNRNSYPAYGFAVTESNLAGAPDEISIYTTEDYYNTFGRSVKLRRHTIRMDGFVSLHAPMAGGEMLTKPLVFKGKELVINFSTSGAGSISIEIQDEAGNVIKGFAFDDCGKIYGDSIERVVSWKGKSDVGELAGKPIRLCFRLKDADLYSFRFKE